MIHSSPKNILHNLLTPNVVHPTVTMSPPTLTSLEQRSLNIGISKYGTSVKGFSKNLKLFSHVVSVELTEK